MNILLTAFLIALACGLLLTPLARKLGQHCGGIDVPDSRKQHLCPTARTGGLAVILAHILGLLSVILFFGEASMVHRFTMEVIALWAGAVVAFGIGFYDDFRRQGAKVKLTLQVLAASIAFAGGVNVDATTIFGDTPILGWMVMDYLLTVFWFVLLINAMNLIDGLDGLAGGIALFVCLVMSILQVVNGNYFIALYFIALLGAIAGFLRYNFNPATIFLGDGGSYYAPPPILWTTDWSF